jgi:L-amino acid N-acyltransferase YncA
MAGMNASAQITGDLLIREATALDSAALANVHVASWRAAYRGIIDDDWLDAMSVDAQLARWTAWFRSHRSSSFTRVAVDARARVIGFATGGEARVRTRPTLGEVYTIYLLPEVQRRGIGARLMRSMARGLDLHGMESMLVWSLERNPARDFYARLGGRLCDSRETTVGRQRLGEVAYLWEDLVSLGAAPGEPASRWQD